MKSADSDGISVTGETPREHGFRDEEERKIALYLSALIRTPHGKRALGTEINGIEGNRTFSEAL